jgi:hypothetical protein
MLVSKSRGSPPRNNKHDGDRSDDGANPIGTDDQAKEIDK